MPPRIFNLSQNWIMEIDGIERVRWGSVEIPPEGVTDIVTRQSAQTFPDRQPGNYQPVDVVVLGPSYTDPSTKTLFNKTVNVIDGGSDPGDELYFSADVIQLAMDLKTEIEKYRLHRCYCGERRVGDFNAETEAARIGGFVLRPQWIENLIIT